MVNAMSPWPVYGDLEIDRVVQVLRSGRVNQWTGQEVVGFNREFAGWVGTGYAIGLANGTLALEAGLRACGIGPGDEVIVTPRTFFASASSIHTVGATPVFCDVDRDSGNITPHSIGAVLTVRTKAIIAVHLAGWPCDMEGIMDLARAHDLWVIEDCAQAHGGMHRGKPLGSWGDIGAWSFCQDKIMTTGGEGGAITTDNSVLWERVWSWKDHGKNFMKASAANPPPGFRWLHDSMGTNWRMMEIQAAIGRIQLARMEDWHAQRSANAATLRKAVYQAGSVARAPEPNEQDRHAYYRFYCYVQHEALRDGWSRDRIIARAAELGLPLFQGSCSEIYLEKAFDNAAGRPSHRLPIARELGETSLMALVHPTLSSRQIEHCAQILEQVLREAQR